MRSLSAAAIVCLLASPAMALQEAAPGKLDAQMVTAAYNPGQVYVLHVPQGQTAQITVAPTEVVKHCFGFDNNMLRAVPVGNLVEIWSGSKPVRPRTVFVLALTMEGQLRTYTFLVDTQPLENAEISFTFTYPGDVAAHRAALWRQAQTRRIQQTAERTLAEASGTTDTNVKYVLQGKTTADWDLLPTRQVSDNGTETHFWFPGNMTVPIIYAVSADGKTESVVEPTFDSRTGIATVHQLAPMFHLRDGDNLLCIYNRAFDPIGVRSPTNTISPNVERVTAQ